MAYTLHALVGRTPAIQTARTSLKQATAIPLQDDLWLIPLQDTLTGEASTVFPTQLKDPFGGFEKLSAPIADWIEGASRTGTLAYLEAEYFGGVGEQSSVVWKDGKVVDGPHQARDAINLALRCLGVSPEPGKDEFDTVGLGRHRSTEKWI